MLDFLKFKKEIVILILILTLAAFLRFWQLTSVPPSLNWDEAALGYNAYSILETGKDEYGKFFPIVFKSFGDYKPGIYVYLAVPFVAVFGLTEFAVRAPSALFGVLTVLVLYLTVYEFSQNKKLALISSFFLAISPWHILISRPAFEANIALFFNLAGILFFLKFIKNQRYFYFFLFTFSFLLSLYTYQTSKLMVPLILLGLIIFWFKDLINIPKKFKILTSLFIILALPIYIGFIFGNQGGRFEVFSLFSYPRTESEINKVMEEDNFSKNSLQFQIFHSEPLYFTKWIVTNYLNHFSSRYLFFDGDFQNDRTRIPGMGMMYFFDILFLILGFYVFFNLLKVKQKQFLLYWLAISPLPAVITRDAVSPIRASNQTIPLIIFSALGFLYLLDKFKKIKLVFWIVISIVILANIILFVDGYFIHFPKTSAKGWVYGYKQAVEIINDRYNDVNNVVLTTAYNEPYIFVLFYTKYPPAKYQPQANLEQIRGPKDVGEVKSFDKYSFRHINYPGDLDLKNSLLIGATNELREDEIIKDVDKGKLTLDGDINFPDGLPAFRIVTTK